MKKYYFALILTLFVLPIFAQNIPSYVPKDGLVGYWPFNGNANDASGNGNHGIVYGASLATDRNGNVNSAYNFDNDSIKCNIKKLLINNTPFSINAWFKSSIITNADGWPDWNVKQDIPSDAYIYQFGSGKNQVSTSIYGKGYLQIWPTYYSIQDQSYHANNWFCLSVIYTGDSLKTYINGNNNQYYNNGFRNQNNLDSILMIGRNFKGFIDDISIYNRELNVNEIQQLYFNQPKCQTNDVVIDPLKSNSFCEGSILSLKTTEKPGRTYRWLLNDNLLLNNNKSVLEVSQQGNYSVVISDGSCFMKSKPVSIYMQYLPSKGISLSQKTTSICEKDSIVLTAYEKGTYLWNTGATVNNITVKKSGKYYAKISNQNCTTTSDTIKITVNPRPNGVITVKAKQTICTGDTVILQADGGDSYTWNTGATKNQIQVNNSGYYTVTIKNAYNCYNYISQNVLFNVLPKMSLDPLKSILFKSDSPIQLSGYPLGGSYIGDAVIGATFYPSLAKSGKKNISYQLVSAQGCKNSITVSTILVDTNDNKCVNYDTILKIKLKLTTGIKTNQYTDIHVYPNPTSDLLILDVSDVIALNGYKFKIYELLGKEVYGTNITTAKTEISLKALGAKGMYVLHILDANNVRIQSQQIVLE
jgi:hypothetical protein